MLSPAPGEKAPLMGDAKFDATDRLAIINLLGAYVQIYDAGRLDEWQTVFADAADVRFFAHDRVTSSSLAEIRVILDRVVAGWGANDQRRHCVSSVWFTSQDASEASGRCYLQVFRVVDGGAPAVAITGCYEFTAIKQDNAWKFSRWIAHLDQTG